eukprot:CAMPEP_0194353684 /NCGR_PEP_ID=MMETSP0174-20130528/1965_1 /TAXON_ID=216777 /ORGANISM="Proboscia alata, Strain PI-D3" /LENGTH=442 /DNA_ID=CAMNT_0039122339 /DNA_START=10 /DNA_END=1338 /DNA_ORIENTATION=-
MPPRKKIKLSSTADASSSINASKSVCTHKQISEWKESNCETLLYLYPSSVPQSCKIAGFDIDDTIIKTKSGKTFATNDLTDWQLWSASVKSTLLKLSTDGYRIVFFTNQEGISKGKVNKNSWMKKIENVIQEVGLKDKVTVLASLNRKENDFRKPHIGMWTFLSSNLTDLSAKPDAGQSIYVGDAAGRPKRGSAKRDFSCTDYKFALNIGGGIKFHTPEQLFSKSNDRGDGASLTGSNMGFQPKNNWKSYLDKNLPVEHVGSVLNGLIQSCRTQTKNEIIVIVGSPASGKSSITQHIVNQTKGQEIEYDRVNQDTLKTLKKCLDAADKALKNGKSPIIDNTNRDTETRKKYISIANKHKVGCKCIYLNATKEVSFHLNALRGAVGNVHGEKRSVPDVVIHSFYKKLNLPTVGEGFDGVVELEFVPGPFETQDKKDSFFKFTH